MKRCKFAYRSTCRQNRSGRAWRCWGRNWHHRYHPKGQKKCDLDPYPNPYVIMPNVRKCRIVRKIECHYQRIEHPYRCPLSTPAVPSSLPRVKLLPRKKTDEIESSKGPVSSEPMVDDVKEARKPGSVLFAPSSSVIQSLSWWSHTFARTR
jgi:hypothetical protein